jgi:pyridoxine/pyridoxamine 5'-phosphate oxidase
MKAKIKKTSRKYNNEYFKSRSLEKNALAISSNQSKLISSYDLVIEKYNEAKKEKNLKICPEYWGGFSFKPYEIEFWEGSDFRLNKRNLYQLADKIWHHQILEP